MQSHSPPPLRHPVPTHPTYIPEPPPTPNSAQAQGYQRYTSSPTPPIPQNPYQQPHQVPAYTSPFQHSQPGYGQHHPQQQQQGQGPPHESSMPDFAAWGVDNATAHFGMQLSQSAITASQDYVQRNFGTIFPSTTLKHHFNVSNAYVINKIKVILFPWLHKPWGRKPKRTEGQVVEWHSPREDINSPDLYIPVMAIVTYILLCALYAGLQGQFHTKVLGEASSRAIVVLLLDFAFIKLGCYFLNVQSSSQVVDIVSYAGYKFVGVIFALTATFLQLGSWLQTIAFLYAFLANGFFLLRSLRSVILPDTHSSGSTTTANTNPSARRRRIAFLFIVAVSQILYMGLLVRLG